MDSLKLFHFSKWALGLFFSLNLPYSLSAGAQIFSGSCPGDVGVSSTCGITTGSSDYTGLAASTSTSAVGSSNSAGTGIGTGTTTNNTGSGLGLPGSTNSSSNITGNNSISNIPATGDFGGSISGGAGSVVAPGVNNTAGLPGGGIVNQPGLSLPPTGQFSNSASNSTNSTIDNTGTLMGGSTIAGSPPLPIDNSPQNLPGGATLGQSAGVLGGSNISPGTGIPSGTTGGQAAGTSGMSGP